MQHEQAKKLDIVIPIVSQDVSTFIRSYPFLMKNLPAKSICLISNKDTFPLVSELPNVKVINEDELIEGLTLDKIKETKKRINGSPKRSGWYFQQFLKMAYAEICEDDYYLIWDADTIPIVPIRMFDEQGKPYMGFRDYVKYDNCFFETQDRLLPNLYLKKTTKDSFICEHMLVKTSYMRELIVDLAEKGTMRKQTFYENILYTVPLHLLNLSGFSEFETYSAYVLKKYPNAYSLRYWKNLRNGKIYLGNLLDEGRLKWISRMFDVVSIEKFNNQWIVNKLLMDTGLYKHFSFKTIYGCLNPIYNLLYDIRFKLRAIIK